MEKFEQRQIGCGFVEMEGEPFPEMGAVWRVFRKGDLQLKLLEIGPEQAIFVISCFDGFPIELGKNWYINRINNIRGEGILNVEMTRGNMRDKYVLFNTESEFVRCQLMDNGGRSIDVVDFEGVNMKVRGVRHGDCLSYRVMINGFELPISLNLDMQVVGVRRQYKESYSGCSNDKGEIMSVLVRSEKGIEEVCLTAFKQYDTAKRQENNQLLYGKYGDKVA
ncbi:hypothetical protein KKG71_05300 [Patescibacteria group bacterium]|nr:hypothetical protein [Patescibacteria group bacterium]